MGTNEVPHSVARLVLGRNDTSKLGLYGASAGSVGGSCGAVFMIRARILSWIAIRSLSLSASPSHLFSSLCVLLRMLNPSRRGCAL